MSGASSASSEVMEATRTAQRIMKTEVVKAEDAHAEREMKKESKF